MNKVYNKKKFFVKFLKENKCLSSFKRNYFKQKSKNHRNLNSIIKNNYPSVIVYSFTWDQTFEGQEFWEDLHYKWRHLLMDANLL